MYKYKDCYASFSCIGLLRVFVLLRRANHLCPADESLSAISVKSPARFLEWQCELSLMFNSRNVCGTWRGRGKCLSVFVFQSRIFSHVFFSFIHSSFMQHRCPEQSWYTAFVLYTVGCLSQRSPTRRKQNCLTAACVCFGNMTIFPYMFNSNKNDKARENPRAF